MQAVPLFRPFKGIRPVPQYAADVIAPPYDVLNADEAREKAAGKPFSFLHISKAEIDLPKGTDPYSSEVYAKSAENYNKMLQDGILKQDEKPCYYVYKAVMGNHVQTGLAVAASVEEYDKNRIRKHEFTRVDKEDDRVRQIDALNAQTGPVLLAYRDNKTVADIIHKTVSSSSPAYEVEGENGVIHSLWVIDDDADIKIISDEFAKTETVYIADGHHRSAAASRVAKKRAQENPNHTGKEDYNFFLAVAFPVSEMKILDYNRLIKDLNGMDTDDLIQALAKDFVILPKDKTPAAPVRPHSFGMYIDGQWYLLGLKELPKTDDPVKLLDVSLLSDLVLSPLLGIKDPRTDKRIDFVGGMRGLKELERRVDSKEMAVAFAMYPTLMEDLMAVADSNQVMPPKSTWFEPKLADGMVSNPI